MSTRYTPLRTAVTDVTSFVRRALTDVMATVNVRGRMAPRTPTTFRPPAYTPTTAWGRHLVEFRRARNWSLTYAFEQWAEGLGMSLRSRTAYRLIEQGKREPNAREAAYLISVVGEPTAAAPAPLEATETGDAVSRALLVQAEAIGDLAEQMRQLVIELRLARVQEVLPNEIAEIHAVLAQTGFLSPADRERPPSGTTRGDRSAVGASAADRP